MAGLDTKDLEKKAEQGRGCDLRDLLMDIPAEDHLAIIRELQRKSVGNPKLQIEISDGAKESNFKFSIFHNEAPAGNPLNQAGEKMDDIMNKINKKGEFSKPILTETYKNQSGFVAIHNRQFECLNK